MAVTLNFAGGILGSWGIQDSPKMLVFVRCEKQQNFERAMLLNLIEIGRIVEENISEKQQNSQMSAHCLFNRCYAINKGFCKTKYFSNQFKKIVEVTKTWGIQN